MLTCIEKDTNTYYGISHYAGDYCETVLEKKKASWDDG